MQLQPFSLFKMLLHLSGQLLGSILAPVHHRVQRRKQTRILVATVTSPAVPASLSPTEMEALQVSEAAAPLPEPMPETNAVQPAPVAPILSFVEPSVPSPTALDRQQVVTALLDEAYAQGHSTYPALIAYVKEQSGRGCSKRLVAEWKRQRRLIAGEGEAA